MRATAQNLQTAIKINLIDLRVGKAAAHRAPGCSSVGRYIDAVLSSGIDCAAGRVELERPNRRRRQVTADVTPIHTAVESVETRKKAEPALPFGI
jgi:hypothetical protein